MPIKVSACKGGDVQNRWVSLSLRGGVDTAEGIMTGIKKAKDCFPQDWRVWFPFVSDYYYFFGQVFIWLSEKLLHFVDADFHVQIQDSSAFEVWFQAVERHKLSAEWKSEHGVQLPRRMVIHHFQGLLRSYILTVSAFPLCSKHNLHPFCLLRGKEIEATKMFPEEWLIFTLQERSRIATSTNH